MKCLIAGATVLSTRLTSGTLSLTFPFGSVQICCFTNVSSIIDSILRILTAISNRILGLKVRCKSWSVEEDIVMVGMSRRTHQICLSCQVSEETDPLVRQAPGLYCWQLGNIYVRRESHLKSGTLALRIQVWIEKQNVKFIVIAGKK